MVNPPSRNVKNVELARTVNSPFMFSLQGYDTSASGIDDDQATYISEGVKSSSLSRGWSMSVNISEGNHQRRVTAVYLNTPSSNDCLAIPREASLPAKLAYIPSRAGLAEPFDMVE